MNDRLLNKTERTIIAGIMRIKNGEITPAEAGLGKMLNALKNLDEPLYESLVKKYKEALDSRKTEK